MANLSPDTLAKMEAVMSAYERAIANGVSLKDAQNFLISYYQLQAGERG